MPRPVKPFMRSQLLHLAGLLLLLALSGGCGYKGPLYLPPPPDTVAGDGSTVPDADPADHVRDNKPETGFESTRID